MVLPHAPLPPTDPHLLARRLPERADLLFLAPVGKGRGSYTQNEERISPLYESRFSAELPPLRRLKMAERLPWARTTIILLGFSDT